MNQVVELKRKHGTVLIDGADLDLVRSAGFSVGVKISKGYARVLLYRGRTERVQMVLSRFLLGVTNPKLVVDHINRDSLDNRRSNLRVASASLNKANGPKYKRMDSKSKYKGVTKPKRSRKWRARIRVSGQLIFLGDFMDELDAAKAYDAAASHHFGEFACVNFP